MIESPITFCISTYNNLNYLKLAVESVRTHSYYKDAPFVIYAENCTDGTNEWLEDNEYDLEYYIETNEVPKGIGGGMNICAEMVRTEYIMFLHSDFYVSRFWDKMCLDELSKHESTPTWVFSHRVEPDMFGSPTRPGTLIVPQDAFGAYYDDFNATAAEEWMYEFSLMNNFTIPKAEGVSGLIRKSDWDRIGGNDPQFAPTSWEDMDLFLRMHKAGYQFILTSKSVVWHFGARGSHRLEENNGQSDLRQVNTERINQEKFYKKWGGFPVFNDYGLIIGVK